MTSPSLQVFAIKNLNGIRMTVTNFGGRIMSLTVPDRHGKPDDIVLGYQSPEEYLNGNPYFGAMIGRVGNRISRGRFMLEGKSYQLPINNGPNSLHGGHRGFHNVYWTARQVSASSLELNYLSRDGEEGYPGNLAVKVIYSITDNNELVIDYHATTDRTTIVNLTHHSFFNLAGAGEGDVLGHQLAIFAQEFTPVGEGLIPTGERRKVDGTPFDFRKLRAIGEQIDTPDIQLQAGKGYDHNWILDRPKDGVTLAARVSEPKSGRIMEVWTTEPGLQFYSGNFLTGKDIGKNGKAYSFRGALCLEAQHFPNSPNQPDFPSIVLGVGQIYTQKTVYRFLVDM